MLVFDRERFLSRLCGNVDLALELIGLFEGDWPRLRGLLQEAFSQGELQGLVRAVHSIKGAGVTLPAPEALATILHLEVLLENGDLAGAAEAVEILELQVEQLQIVVIC